MTHKHALILLKKNCIKIYTCSHFTWVVFFIDLSVNYSLEYLQKGVYNTIENQGQKLSI